MLCDITFTNPPPTHHHTLSLHDALPIYLGRNDLGRVCDYGTVKVEQLMTVERFSHVMHLVSSLRGRLRERSEEHTSELQSPMYIVCRLLLYTKKRTK